MKKIEETNKKLFGDYSVAVNGFEAEQQRKLLKLIEESFATMKVVFINKRTYSQTLEEIFSKEHKYGFLNDSYGKAAIIMSGFLEKEIINFMKAVRTAGIAPGLWAVLTPTSNKWKFSDLIKELQQEAEEIRKMQKRENKPTK